MWQSEAHLNLVGLAAISVWQLPLMKSVKGGCCDFNGVLSLFLWNVLQAQKLLKLEEAEVEAEEEPKGEAIVGLSGEALRPLGMGTTFTHINFLSFGYIWTAAPFVVFYFRSPLLGKTSMEDKGDTEEPEISTPEQARFDWACVWMEEGGSPAMAENKVQRLLNQVICFPDPFLFCSI